MEPNLTVSGGSLNIASLTPQQCIPNTPAMHP